MRMVIFTVTCRRWTGRTPFDPNGRYVHRSFDIECENADHAETLFGIALDNKIETVDGFEFVSAVESNQ